VSNVTVGVSSPPSPFAAAIASRSDSLPSLRLGASLEVVTVNAAATVAVMVPVAVPSSWSSAV